MTYMPTIILKLVDLAGRLGITVIAEGVESRRTAESLLHLGVRHMQGFLFGRPAPQIAENTGRVVPVQEATVTRSQLLPT